jgi:aminoglycoside/choline kinase family phosphotransferase
VATLKLSKSQLVLDFIANEYTTRTIDTNLASSVLSKLDQFEINFLAGDASFRRYARVKLQNKTYMLMDAPPEKEDCVPFVEIDEFFDKNGVRVPHIVAKDLSLGLLLLEDFGDVVLSTLLNDDTVDQYYAQSFKQLIELQQIDGISTVASIFL